MSTSNSRDTHRHGSARVSSLQRDVVSMNRIQLPYQWCSFSPCSVVQDVLCKWLTYFYIQIVSRVDDDSFRKLSCSGVNRGFEIRCTRDPKMTLNLGKVLFSDFIVYKFGRWWPSIIYIAYRFIYLYLDIISYNVHFRNLIK